MEITITISERAERKIREQAESNGKDVSEFIGEFVEERFANGNGNLTKESKTENTEGEKKRKHNLLKFAGMFSSGKTDTSERMHEILYSEDFDPAEGFSIK